MYQIAVRNQMNYRLCGVINTMTWKRYRGQAIIRQFNVTDKKKAALCFDLKEDAEMVADALFDCFGLNVILQKVKHPRARS